MLKAPFGPTGLHDHRKAGISSKDERSTLGGGKRSMPETFVAMEQHSALGQVPEYDAIVIGAGISGMFMLYRLRQLGMTTRVFEAGSDIGGTWYWNRYPGARYNSESWTYGYSFPRSCCRSGTGKSISRHSPTRWNTSTSWPRNSTCGATCSSTAR